MGLVEADGERRAQRVSGRGRERRPDARSPRSLSENAPPFCWFEPTLPACESACPSASPPKGCTCASKGHATRRCQPAGGRSRAPTAPRCSNARQQSGRACRAASGSRVRKRARRPAARRCRADSRYRSRSRARSASRSSREDSTRGSWFKTTVGGTREVVHVEHEIALVGAEPPKLSLKPLLSKCFSWRG